MTSPQQAPSVPHLHLRLAASIPKIGLPQSDCQDACAVDLEGLRFAVSDGAGTSFFPGEWARLLADSFCHGDPRAARRLTSADPDWRHWLKPLRERWRLEVNTAVSSVGEIEQVLFQNRVQERDAAWATLVGVIFDPSAMTWRAVVMGDSCLLHIRDGALLSSYALTASREFTSVTSAIPSTLEATEISSYEFSGDLRVNDTFVLATDALAKWLIQRHEQGGARWGQALAWTTALDGAAGLRRFAAEAVALDDAIAHDDVTAIILCVQDGAPPATESADPRGVTDARSGRWHEPDARYASQNTSRSEVTQGPAEVRHTLSGGHMEPATATSRRTNRLLYLTILISLISLAISGFVAWRLRDLIGLRSAPVLVGGATYLHAAPDTRSSSVLHVQNMVMASLRAPERGTRVWYPVELKLWVQDGPNLVAIRRDSVRIMGRTPARTAPTAGGRAIVGRLLAGNVFEVERAIDMGARRWYLLRVPGYAGIN